MNLDGSLNRQNHRDWMPWGSGGNPHFRHDKPTKSEGIMIWAAAVGDGTKLPLVVIGTERFDSHKYLQMLQDLILPHPSFPRMTFQQVIILVLVLVWLFCSSSFALSFPFLWFASLLK